MTPYDRLIKTTIRIMDDFTPAQADELGRMLELAAQRMAEIVQADRHPAPQAVQAGNVVALPGVDLEAARRAQRRRRRP